MSISEQIARAELSDDLHHHAHDCSIDVVGAVGMSANRNPQGLVFHRLKVAGDRTSLRPALIICATLARHSMTRRGKPPQNAARLGEQALSFWLSGICQKCHGRGHPKIKDTPSLSDRDCPACSGTGKKQLRGHPEAIEVMQDVIDRIDIYVRGFTRSTKYKFGDIKK